MTLNDKNTSGVFIFLIVFKVPGNKLTIHHSFPDRSLNYEITLLPGYRFILY